MTAVLNANRAMDRRRSGESVTSLSLRIRSFIAGLASLFSRSLIHPLLHGWQTTGSFSSSLRFFHTRCSRFSPSCLKDANVNRFRVMILFIQSLHGCSPPWSTAGDEQKAHCISRHPSLLFYRSSYELFAAAGLLRLKENSFFVVE